ncbi:MAG TPA: PspC domain-containing protein [Roseiflexaceae bacterium]|nr:PspC domain-containing protein [Roseiflexaceae bacterium]
MQQRLVRSRSERMIAGVCGGLAQAYRIDPVVVRLIFVLVTVITGFGLLIYPILWFLMPEEPKMTSIPHGSHGAATNVGTAAEAGDTVYYEQQARTYAHASRYSDQPPPPEAYRYNPITGEPIGNPSLGATVSLDPTQANMAQHTAAPVTARPRSRARWVGMILLGFGAMLLADELGMNMDLIFPLLMIGLGMLVIFRR